MTLQTLVALVGLALGGGGLGVALDRWRYRRKPALDIMALAQQIAERALSQAHAELVDAYQDATRARHDAAAAYAEARQAQDEARDARTELSEVRLELAAARIEIQRLVSMLQIATAHP